MARNGIMFQYFEWYMNGLDSRLWIQLKEDANHLKDIGITSVWIPPVFKGTSPFDTGYGIYDLYDLGEFDQKGSVKTKYGTKDELLEAIRELHRCGIHVYVDVVLNHKANGDEKETFLAREVDPYDRNKAISEPYEIESWTKFTFEGRGDQYSSFKWNWTHFSGVDFNERDHKRAIYRIEGINKGWSKGVNFENGNFDYLMFNNVDYKHPDVVKEIRDWAIWFVNFTGVDGFRFDAVKHINDYFMRDLIRKVRGEYRTDFYFVGEYWTQNHDEMSDYLYNVGYEMDLFDVKLHFNMHSASSSLGHFDMSKIFDDTLVKEHPDYAVTFVDNHDSQPTQGLQSWVEPWFKPLAYALILLRKGGYPMIFYGDYYGIRGPEQIAGYQAMIDILLYIRTYHAYGEEVDHLDDPNVIGWVRMGDEVHPYGCAVVMSNGEGGVKKMNVGSINQGAVYADYTGNRLEKITISEDGSGEFPCNGGQVSVWIRDHVLKEDAFKVDKKQ